MRDVRSSINHYWFYLPISTLYVRTYANTTFHLLLKSVFLYKTIKRRKTSSKNILDILICFNKICLNAIFEIILNFHRNFFYKVSLLNSTIVLITSILLMSKGDDI